ncbi:MAG: ABC transporter permease [Ilumatobacteraceae bacterium]
MTTTTTSNRPGAATPFRRRPLASLARAEYLQFRRNKTLVFMGVAFPVLVPLVFYFAARSSDDGVTPSSVANALDSYAMYALVFVLFYPMLSMVTTRRGEGVLKRLRTGEATDRQILAAPAVPGLVLIAVSAVVVGGIVYATGAPAPVNPLAFLVALAAGVPLFALLALATSAVTKNAEAAQITSLPVMALAIAGLATSRQAMPDAVAAVVDRTPYAAISDIVHLGAEGKVVGAADDAIASDFAGTFTDMGRPLTTVAAWTVLALVVAYKGFRWDDRT